MVIFHSYVSLPEGNINMYRTRLGLDSIEQPELDSQMIDFIENTNLYIYIYKTNYPIERDTSPAPG